MVWYVPGMVNPFSAALLAREALPLAEQVGARLLAESGFGAAAGEVAGGAVPVVTAENSIGAKMFRPKGPFHFDVAGLPANRNSADFQLQVSSQLGLDPLKLNSGRVAILHPRISQGSLDFLTKNTSRDLGAWGSSEQGVGVVEYHSLPSTRGYLKPSEAVVRITKTFDANAPISQADRASSGVVVTADGKIATNEHVVRNAAKLAVETHDGKTYLAQVVNVDAGNDLAILQLSDVPKGMKFTVPSFADSQSLMQGSRVAAFGHHGGLKGMIASPGQFSGATTWAKNRYAIDGVFPGASGSPIFDNQGQLVGLVAKVLPNVPERVTGPSSDLIKRALMQLGVRMRDLS